VLADVPVTDHLGLPTDTPAEATNFVKGFKEFPMFSRFFLINKAGKALKIRVRIEQVLECIENEPKVENSLSPVTLAKGDELFFQILSIPRRWVGQGKLIKDLMRIKIYGIKNIYK
jgi:hypothetical protein